MNSTYTFSVIWLSVCLFGSNNRKKKKASFFSRSELKWTRQNSISAWADCFVDIMHYHTLLLPFSNYCCTALSVITQSLSSYTVTLFSWLRGLRLMLESAVWVWWGGKICDDQLFTFTFFSLFQKATIHPSIHPSIHAHTLTHSHTHTRTHTGSCLLTQWKQVSVNLMRFGGFGFFLFFSSFLLGVVEDGEIPNVKVCFLLWPLSTRQPPPIHTHTRTQNDTLTHTHTHKTTHTTIADREFQKTRLLNFKLPSSELRYRLLACLFTPSLLQ